LLLLLHAPSALTRQSCLGAHLQRSRRGSGTECPPARGDRAGGGVGAFTRRRRRAEGGVPLLLHERKRRGAECGPGAGRRRHLPGAGTGGLRGRRAPGGCGAHRIGRARQGAGLGGRWPRERPRVSLPRCGEHRIQAGGAARRSRRDRPDHPGTRPAVQRSLPRSLRRGYRECSLCYGAARRLKKRIWNGSICAPVDIFRRSWTLAQRLPSVAVSGRFVSTLRGGFMSFHTSKESGVVVVDVDGQLIVGNRQELKQKVLDELEGGERKFLIDFANTGYIDSSGLGVLVSLSKKIREQGGELRLSNLNEDLRTLFELTKLDTLFKITDTKAEALEGF